MHPTDELAAPEFLLLRDVLGDEDVAHAVVTAPGGWRDLAEHELGQLNLTEPQQKTIKAIQQLCQRGRPEPPYQKLLQPEDVARVYQARLAGTFAQLMLAVALDCDGYFMQELMVGKHTGHGHGLDPIHVLRPLIRAGAEAFLLVHYNPSGEPKLYPDLRFLIEKVHLAATVVGLPMLDMLVVGRHGWLSVKQEGLLDPE